MSETLTQDIEYQRKVHSLLGKTVEVIIDRPLGSFHPKYDDLFYEVNYGYIEDFLAPDGEYQDAYLLGVDFPVKSHAGRVIAIIHRLDDNEDKLVVVPENISLIAREIETAVAFQEKYYHHELILE